MEGYPSSKSHWRAILFSPEEMMWVQSNHEILNVLHKWCDKHTHTHSYRESNRYTTQKKKICAVKKKKKSSVFIFKERSQWRRALGGSSQWACAGLAPMLCIKQYFVCGVVSAFACLEWLVGLKAKPKHCLISRSGGGGEAGGGSVLLGHDDRGQPLLMGQWRTVEVRQPGASTHTLIHLKHHQSV